MTARLLMVALDAADSSLLRTWCDAGHLPSLAALRARGCEKRLAAPPGATDDALWASFQYGLPLGEHGRYHYRLPLRGGHLGMAHVEESHLVPFWQSLGRDGARVAVLDVPKCPAPRHLNGIQLADWLVHGRYFAAPVSFPAGLAAEVVARFGPAPASRCDYHQPAPSDSDLAEIAGNLRLAVARKRAAGLHYLDQEPWDLFVIGFKEAHCAGHGLWDLVDPRHARYDPARATRLGHLVRQVFEDLDAAIGALVAAAGTGAEVVVFSTGDMEPNGSLDHLMPGVVQQINRHLARNRNRPIRRLAATLAGGREEDSGLGCQLLPYNENFAALRLPPSTGRRGRRRRDLRQIERLLRDLRDVDSGLPAVDAFVRPATDLSGERAAALPDLLAHYHGNAFPGAVESPELGRIAGRAPRLRPGNHAGGGLCIAAGARAAAALSGVAGLEHLAALAVRVLARQDQPDRDGAGI